MRAKRRCAAAPPAEKPLAAKPIRKPEPRVQKPLSGPPGKKAIEKPASAKSIRRPEMRGRPRKPPSGPAPTEKPAVVDLVGDAAPYVCSNSKLERIFLNF